MRRRWCNKEGLLLAAALLLPAFAGNEGASGGLVHVGDVPLGPGVERTDHESIDPAGHRLYIANMGGGQILVFDIEHNKLVARLDGFPKVTGVLVVPELGKLYASVPGSGVISSLFVGLGMAGLSSGRGKVAIYTTQGLREIARLPGGVFPDGIAYDAKHRRILVSDELGSSVIAIDADSDKEMGRVAIGGEVGNVRYDPLNGKVFAPVQSRDELASIDPTRMVVAGHYPMTGGEHPHGFIIAPGGSVGYVACDGNDRLLTVDLETGRVLNNQAVAHDPDLLALDPGLNRLYAASESGNLSIFDISSPNKPVAVGETFVGEGAHAVAADPVSHRLYLALANVGGKLILRELAPKAR